jgi:hypothetical protein
MADVASELMYKVPKNPPTRLDRIERRLDLHELAESQRPYEPK